MASEDHVDTDEPCQKVVAAVEEADWQSWHSSIPSSVAAGELGAFAAERLDHTGAGIAVAAAGLPNHPFEHGCYSSTCCDLVGAAAAVAVDQSDR